MQFMIYNYLESNVQKTKFFERSVLARVTSALQKNIERFEDSKPEETRKKPKNNTSGISTIYKQNLD